MMKVAYRNAEYRADLPPYRFMPGDVIEVEDAEGERLIRQGIAVKAKADAKTAMERRVEMRPPTPDDGGAAERAARRAALQAELDALDRADAAPPATEGHFSDMVTRGGAPGAQTEAPPAEEDEDDDKKPASRAGRK